MSTTVGLGGSRRNVTAALAVDGHLLAVCAEERVTRSRRVGSVNGQLPHEAIKTVLALGGQSLEDVSSYVVGETGLASAVNGDGVVLGHHRLHAASAFLTSSFRDAAVLVCDRHTIPELSVWSSGPGGLRRLEFEWTGPAFATLYAQAAEALGFGGDGDEHKLEALARTGRCGGDDEFRGLVNFRHDHLEVSSTFQTDLQNRYRSNGHDVGKCAADVAHVFQRHLGGLLLELVSDIRRATVHSQLCLAGGLFYNSYFNSVVQESGMFDSVFVPIDPGNPGLAAGAALCAPSSPATRTVNVATSPFLGPESSPSDIKKTLENCKLSYSLLDEEELIAQTVDALAKGYLVGWFRGRMEWGARALGNRSILASPLAPYASENLNIFLKHREPYRSYGVSVCEEEAQKYFDGLPLSPFMECEYRVKDPHRFRELVPASHPPMRVHTVGESPAMFRRLLKAFGAETGVPVLVNTSFNGFREPIVCTPRDAVRVFYGTGLDMVVIGNFVLRK